MTCHRFAIALALAATLVAPVTAQRGEDLSAAERRLVEAQMDSLRRQLRELERRLGATGVYLRSLDRQPFIWSFATDNRARLGVVVRTERGDSDRFGAELQAVTPSGPAHEAGLRSGDIIVRFNGQALAGGENPGNRLIELAGELDDGDTVRVEYRRDGRNANATIVARAGHDLFRFRADTLRLRGAFQLDSARGLMERALVQAREMPALRASLFISRWSDLELTTLDDQLGSYFGTTEGVLVVKAASDSLLGLQSGDVILRIGGRVPTSPSHAMRILRSYEPGDEIRLDVMRQRQRRELRATVPETGR
jgi:S1-C subfamily serine protease